MRILITIIVLCMLLSACGKTANTYETNHIKVSAGEDTQIDKVNYERLDNGLVSVDIEWSGNQP